MRPSPVLIRLVAALTLSGASLASAEAGFISRRSAGPDESRSKTVIRVDRQVLENGAGAREVIVDVSNQRAYLLIGGVVAVDTPVSTARKGKHTPRGSFVITERVRRGKTSSIYGCSMPYWMRLDGSPFGLHVGELPGYPASAGCVRLPWKAAEMIFENTGRGTSVRITDAWNRGSDRIASR